MATSWAARYARETINYLRGLINQKKEIPDFILDSLIDSINNIEDEKEKRKIVSELEYLIGSKKWKKYKKNYEEDRSVSILESKLEYEKSSEELSVSIFDYVFKMITKYKALIYMDSVFKKYKYYLDVIDKDGNSLLYNLILLYLKGGEEYILTCISYILEVSDKDYSDELISINKIINGYKKNNTHYLKIKNLEALLSSYYKDSYKKKITSADISYVKRNNYGGERFVHEKELLVSDYKDRVELFDDDDIPIGITNSNLVENSYNVKTLPNGNIEIYHNIADISSFLKKDSKIEKHAEKQIFLMPHKNYTGSLFPPKFLKEYVSFNNEQVKLAITVKHTFDESGNYLCSDVFRSVIRMGSVFRKEQINYLINHNEDVKLKKFYDVMKKMRTKRGEFRYKIPSNILIEETNRLTADYLNSFMKRKKTPVIYESPLDLRNFDVLDNIKEFTAKRMDYHTRKDLERLFDRVNPKQREYLIEEEPGSTLMIGNSFRTFLDYENIKNLDRLLKYGQLSKDGLLALKDKLRNLSVRASAVDLSRKKL